MSADLEKRLRALEQKGMTSWAKIPAKLQMAVAFATVVAVIYLLADLHLL